FSCTPPARTSIQTISLHDALPILEEGLRGPEGTRGGLEEGALLSPSSSPPLPNAAIAGILLYAPQNQVFRALAAFVRSYAGLEETHCDLGRRLVGAAYDLPGRLVRTAVRTRSYAYVRWSEAGEEGRPSPCGRLGARRQRPDATWLGRRGMLTPWVAHTTDAGSASWSLPSDESGEPGA